jgi:hypothetical protein
MRSPTHPLRCSRGACCWVVLGPEGLCPSGSFASCGLRRARALAASCLDWSDDGAAGCSCRRWRPGSPAAPSSDGPAELAQGEVGFQSALGSACPTPPDGRGGERASLGFVGSSLEVNASRVDELFRPSGGMRSLWGGCGPVRFRFAKAQLSGSGSIPFVFGFAENSAMRVGACC